MRVHDEEAASAVRPATANQASVRQSNLALVLGELLASGGGLSRADLAVRTGLTRATVSRLVKDLLDLRLIEEETPTDDGLRGRPPTPLVPASQTVVGVGLEVNVDHLAGCAIDVAGNVVETFYIRGDFARPPEVVMSRLAESTEDLLRNLRKGGLTRVAGVGLAVPGVVDSVNGEVVYAPNLEWQGVRPSDFFEPARALGLELRVDNDANLQALAASMDSPGRPKGPESFLYISGDVGIGGALVRSGKVDAGLRGWAGEIGHMTVDPEGPACHCGSNGCLERYVGSRAIREYAGLPRDCAAERLVEAVETGNARALAAVFRAARALGIAIANVVNLVDVDEILLGTSLAPLVPHLRPEVDYQLDRRLLARNSAEVRIRAASESSFPASRGAALRSLQELFEAPLAH